jgi:hypothetical protein
LHELGLLPAESGLWADTARDIGLAWGEAGAFVGWLDVVWSGPAEPQWQLRDVVHLPPEKAGEGLRPAIDRARARRKAMLRHCRFCREGFTPGHMHEPDVCQGCAERRLGVTH